MLVRLATAEVTNVPFLARAPGLVIPSQTVAIRARVDSQVVEVHFREGDKVAVGQLLFTLDDRSFLVDLKRQQANLATGKAELDNARRQFDRARKLAAGGFESTSELDKARANFETADARTNAIQAEIENLHVRIGYTKIHSAIEGRAGVITATVGNTVKANDAAEALVVVNRISPIRVQTGLPQQVLSALREEIARGDIAVRVIRDGVELPEQGRIDFVDNAINRTTGSFESRATFENQSETLWPGMIVEVVVRLGEDVGVVVIPEVSVQHGTSGDFVFVIESGVAHRRSVEVKRYADGVAVLVSGLNQGEQVAVDGMLSLSEGTPVAAAQLKAPPRQVPADAATPAKAKESAPK